MKGAGMTSGGKERRPNGQGYRDLIVWQKALALVTSVHRTTKGWPREEQFGGLTSQVRRAAVSIPSNIAEGHGRTGPKEFAHHLSISFGSLCELETQLLIAEELEYIKHDDTESLLSDLADVRRLLLGLLRSLRLATPSPPERSATP